METSREDGLLGSLVRCFPSSFFLERGFGLGIGEGAMVYWRLLPLFETVGTVF